MQLIFRLTPLTSAAKSNGKLANEKLLMQHCSYLGCPLVKYLTYFLHWQNLGLMNLSFRFWYFGRPQTQLRSLNLGWRTFQPQKFNPGISTLDFSTMDSYYHELFRHFWVEKVHGWTHQLELILEVDFWNYQIFFSNSMFSFRVTATIVATSTESDGAKIDGFLFPNFM